ncbi:hypothetical protein G3N58_15305 [Paraburkholderia sp. Ac-20342]|uniref:hypothetical protein n=1 Tax=Paraburkholderia sp. Ac-20342 TaxID=2703889 RepID=UPI0019812D37|nr:hypothetical protein [Paraburkholderia sp. Ac-20342]MBN3848188.1 hypothetical protein [Paraburkholderia sp. Ac-20342]
MSSLQAEVIVSESKLTPNRPSPEGYVLGAQLARLTDKAEPIVRAQFPDHKARCKSCAFTAGTFPNGCLPTVMDALKCTLDGTPFHCHQEFDENGTPTDLCAGWAIAATQVDDRLRKILAPIVNEWELSCLFKEPAR